MTLDLVALWLGALSFAFFGLWLLVRPGALSGVGINADNPDARTELRAMYGGFELGIAAFLALCILRPEWTAPGLWLMLLSLGGLMTGRLIGIALDGGRVSRILWLFAGLELVAVLVTLAAIAQY